MIATLGTTSHALRAGLLAVLLLAMLLAAAPFTAHALTGSQPAATTVHFMEYQVGRLDDATPEARYAITLAQGMVFSISAFMRTGDVVPQVTVYAPDGRILSTGTLPAGATDSSVINAAIAPETGVYTAHLERQSGTGGDYVFIVQPGYEMLHAWDNFEDYDARLSLCWEPSVQLDSMWTINDGEMVAYVLSPSTTSFNAPCNDFSLSTYYVEAAVHITNPPDYYEYGLEIHKNPQAAEFYAVLFSSKGDWAMMYFESASGWSVVQDWTVSPLIHSAETPVTIGVWAQGDTFTVYYDHQVLGQVIDPFPRALTGTPALLVSSGSNAFSGVEAHFDDIVITGPRVPAS